MTTILIVGDSDGARRCDAKCHDAVQQECDCICNGRYHGKGAGAQAQLTADVLGGDAADWRAGLGLDPSVQAAPIQTSLLNEPIVASKRKRTPVQRMQTPPAVEQPALL